MNKEKNPYLSIWELDPTSKEKKEQFSHLIDKEFEADIEKKISKYIQKNLSFTLLEIFTKEDRLDYEARLIGTVSGCSKCFGSESWLGKFSPTDKIKNSGLWQVIGLYSQPLSDEELTFVSEVLVRR